MIHNGKHLDGNRVGWRQSFRDNSPEAWKQIKALTRGPLFWIVCLLLVFFLSGAVLALRFIYTVRAPELTTHPPAPTEVTVEPSKDPVVAEVPEEIDYSNAVQPLLSGARKENCYTFLLFGTDKEGTNTDTIMVVSYDVGNQKLNLMSIPRDTMVNVGWDIKKINSVYGMRGLNGFQKQIAKLIGFTPDYYVKIDLQAFVDVVDLIGGVEYDVPFPMHYHDPYQDLSIDLEPGLQTLNGEQAMGLVRFRKSDRSSSGRVTGYDDTGRVQTQQAFLREMFKKCVKLTNWTKISSYVEIFEKNVESDLSLGNMLWFARQAMFLEEDGFLTVTAPGNYYASAYSRSTDTMQSYVTLYGREMVRLVNESFNPYLTQVSLANMDIMGVNSDGSVYSSTGHVADSRAAMPVTRPSAASNEPDKPDEPEHTAQPEEPDIAPPAEGCAEEPADTTGEQPPAESEPPADAETNPETGAPDEQTPPEPADDPEPEPEPQPEPTPEPPPETDPEPEPQPEPEPEPQPDPMDTTPTASGDR